MGLGLLLGALDVLAELILSDSVAYVSPHAAVRLVRAREEASLMLLRKLGMTHQVIFHGLSRALGGMGAQI